jgi:putative tricarboxylic transport membrane protein
MKMLKKPWLTIFAGTLLSGALILSGVGIAKAESFPQKAIQLVVPYGPGGGSDISARIFAKYLEKYLPVKVVVKNITGAAGRNGEVAVKNARPDGYTLLWQHQNLHMAYATGRTREKWDDMYVPVASAVKAYSVIVVSKSSPFNTINDLVKAGMENPGKHSFAAGLLSNSHFAYLDIISHSKAKVSDFHLIPIVGDKNRIVALLQGNADATSVTISSTKPYIDSGDLKVLGVMAPERMKAYKDLPTLKEQGVDAEIVFDYTVWAPLGLANNRTKVLADAIIKASYDPDLEKEMDKLWISVEHLEGDALIKKIKTDFAQYDNLAKKYDIHK